MMKYALLALLLIIPACSSPSESSNPTVSNESVEVYATGNPQEIDSEDTNF